MRKFLIAAVLAAALPGAAGAATLTFDDSSLPSTNSFLDDPALPNGYFGFDYNNIYILDPNQWPGWDTSAAHSSPNVALNGFGAPATITRGSAFDFVSGWFANGFEGVTVTVAARDAIGGAVTHSVTFDTDVDPALQTFNWTGIRELDFSSAPTSGVGYGHFSMDDLTVGIGSGAPEPAGWALMILGFGGAGAMLRRRAAKALA